MSGTSDRRGLSSSFKNMKAGKVCGIIGLCLSAAYFIFLIIYIVAIGAALSTLPWATMGGH